MSNHKPYTPETIDIKMAYVLSFDPEGVHKILANMVAEMTTGHAADFDRWLAEHDRETKRDALLAAQNEIIDQVGEGRTADIVGRHVALLNAEEK